jgi:hypothetical protein
MRRYNIRDVVALEPLYLKLRPWIEGHPNVAVYSDSDEVACPKCGSTKLKLNGSGVHADRVSTSAIAASSRTAARSRAPATRRTRSRNAVPSCRTETGCRIGWQVVPGFCVRGYTFTARRTSIELASADWRPSSLAHEMVHVAELPRTNGKGGHCWSQEMRNTLTEVMGRPETSTPEDDCPEASRP